MPHIYIGNWEWIAPTDTMNGYWQPPGGNAIGAIDLRPLEAQGQAGGPPKGFGIFVYEDPNPSAGRPLGSSLDSTISAAGKAQLRNELELPSDAALRDTVRDVIWDILTTHGDLTGMKRCPPLTAENDGAKVIHLGGFESWRS